jgi:hypothetical protein
LAKICVDVVGCNKCEGISSAVFPYGREIGLSYVKPKLPAEVIFVAESPPGSRENFFYNEKSLDISFRERLFKLINLAGLKPVSSVAEFNTRGFYLADAINCRWNKNRTDEQQPSKKQLNIIINNCVEHLVNQIQALKPKAVVFLGKVAQKAGESQKVQEVLGHLNIPKRNIVRMPFILTAPVETEDLVTKLKVLSGMGRNLSDGE